MLWRSCVNGSSFFNGDYPLSHSFCCFFLWVRARARWIVTHNGEVPPIEKGNLFILVLTGLLFVMGSLAFMALWGPEGQPGDSYVAPRIVDGEIVPGRFGS